MTASAYHIKWLRALYLSCETNVSNEVQIGKLPAKTNGNPDSKDIADYWERKSFITLRQYNIKHPRDERANYVANITPNGIDFVESQPSKDRLQWLMALHNTTINSDRVEFDANEFEAGHENRVVVAHYWGHSNRRYIILRQVGSGESATFYVKITEEGVAYCIRESRCQAGTDK